MSAPRWARAILRRAAPPGQEDAVVGDLEEAHRARTKRHHAATAWLLTAFETADMTWALLRQRRRPIPAFSWLDFKLGLRMLVRYPGLTAVGGLAIAFAIWVGAGFFEFGTQLLSPRLPLPDGDGVVMLRLYDVRTRKDQMPTAYDFLNWRKEVTTVGQMSAYRRIRRNLRTGDGPGEPATITRMSATGFDVAGVPPLLGRTLTSADEVPGATDVVVIGHDLWQARFGGNPDVVGRSVQLGRDRATIIGVMPEGFGFPIADQLWTPLRLADADLTPGAGLRLEVFGRVAPEHSIGEARNELELLAVRTSIDFPEAYEHLQVDVVSFKLGALGIPPRSKSAVVAGVISWNVAVVLFVMVICANVALLIFARAAARESELVVRSALGASRARIVAQLFVEALVLGMVGAAVGLTAAGYGLRWGMNVVATQVMGSGGLSLPFWMSDTLSSTTVAYALILTAVGAGVAGILPAFKVTRDVGSSLRRASAGGGGIQFGGVWTVVIVSQVAVTIALPVGAFLFREELVKVEEVDIGVPTDEYLAARLEMDREPPPDRPADTTAAAFAERYRTALGELAERLRAEPSVSVVTFAEKLPLMYHPWHQIEVDEGGMEPPDLRGHRGGVSGVDPGYFEALGVPILSGRGFGAGDLESDAHTVIVNESFVRRVLGGKNPLGRRIQIIASEASREPDRTVPWHEIVGVVPDLGQQSGYGALGPMGVYYAAAPDDVYPIHIAIRGGKDPLSLIPRVLAAATEVDPTLRVQNIIRMDETAKDDVTFYRFFIGLIGIGSGLALLLSMAGIYAVMSFTVSKRTREIGIRVALGSDPTRVTAAIFRRPLLQLGSGVLVGTFLAWVLIESSPRVNGLGALGGAAVYSLLMTCVCLLACVVPTRRALRIEPSEALRADG